MSGAEGCVAPPSRAGWPGAWGSDPAPGWSPRPVRPAWGAPGRTAAVAVAEGSPSQALFCRVYPGGLRTGLGTGSERFLRPRDPRGSAHWRRGSGVLEGECGAPGSGSAGKSEPGQEAGGCGRVPDRDSRPCGPGALSLVRDRVRELSEASPREVFGSAPLEGVAVDHFLPQRRSGRWPRSPSTDLEMAPAEVAGAGRWGRGVGALGLRPVEPRRDSVGFWSLRGLLVVVEGGCERP